MLGSLILVFALCTDTFVASLAYGANRVHVGWGKVALLNGICSGCLGLALGLGNVISSVLPGDVTRIICFVSLFLLGFIKFLDYSIKAYINRHCCIRRNLSFSLSGLKVIVNIYGDPMAADVDGSQSLGWKETVFLALAMSIDSLVAGIHGGSVGYSRGRNPGSVLCRGSLYDVRRPVLGRKVASRFRCDLSWISGVLLMALALMKVLP